MKDLATELDGLKQQHLYRVRNVCSTAQQIEPVINGKKILSFCSNDYLGLANHPKVINALIIGAKTFGVGAGASHLITGHHQCHHALEEELANFIGTERTLLFSTGYMANLGVVSSFADHNSIVFEDRLNHASLIDAGILSRAKIIRYQHLNVEQLHRKLSSTKEKSKFIISDGVFSMDGSISPITNLQAITKDNNAQLIIDDAHGIGVIGKEGRGCTEGILESNTILIGTLGKAFGTFGAFVAGKQDSIEWIMQRARTYIYTTAIPPAIAEATRTSLQIIQEESWRRQKLQKLIDYFRQQCIEAEIPLSNFSTHIQPIIVGASDSALKISSALLDKGILVSAIRPPTVPKDTARLRISFSADHDESHVDQLIEALTESLKSY